MIRIRCTLFIFLFLPAVANEIHLTGDIETVHDPAVIGAGGVYYLFSTTPPRSDEILPIRCSKDMKAWTRCGRVFERLPEWVRQELPDARGAWAPDISFFNGRYHLYYAVSRFGKNTSVIGLATNAALDPKDPAYRWNDEGLVVRSVREDDWNAIDANLAIEDPNHIWLTWGSFWSGIKMRRVDPATGKLSALDPALHSLAARSRAKGVFGSVEAPFLYRHEGWWYLFASFDFCCKGAESSYYVVAGRSREITGPYLDRDGKPMLEGGGTVVVRGPFPHWSGPGHPAILRDGVSDYLYYHAYSAATGKPFLHISPIVWEQGWPAIAPLP
jgi:arabinan endo-1,5-alpha-L-arabinosidase